MRVAATHEASQSPTDETSAVSAPVAPSSIHPRMTSTTAQHASTTNSSKASPSAGVLARDLSTPQTLGRQSTRHRRCSPVSYRSRPGRHGSVIRLVDEVWTADIDSQCDAVPARRWGSATWCRLGSEQIEWVESEAGLRPSRTGRTRHCHRRARTTPMRRRTLGPEACPACRE
jgi:hypothetical protein